ncbi:MAG TPA: AsmA family protein, partial [Puia sp.]|nr:AsmA family protein [Puia sp.]
MKKIAKITALVLASIFVLAVAAPFVFKGKIISLIKTEANNNLNARLDFSDASISLISHFPKISVKVQNLSLVGVDEFSSDTLISAKQIDLAMNLMSIISGNNAKVSGIYIDEPRVHVIVHKNGHANYAIAKTDHSSDKESPAKAGQFKLELQKYVIGNGYISYIDETSGMSSEIIDLNHEGSGDFTSDLFTLSTKTNVAAVNFVYGGIPYLAHAKTILDADIEVNNKTNTYTFKTDQIAINDLNIHGEGFFQMLADAYNMDIKFSAPSTDFKNILSLIPAIYQKDFASIKTSGQVKFGGFVKGKYDNTHMPAYQIALDVKNGFFQYPDLPKSVKNINLTCQVDNPDGI